MKVTLFLFTFQVLDILLQTLLLWTVDVNCVDRYDLSTDWPEHYTRRLFKKETQ